MTAPDLKAIAEHYSQMSEPELMQTARGYDDLATSVQELLRKEFARRSLEPPLLDEADSEPDLRIMITVATFRDLPGAIVARSILEAEGIDCTLLNENFIRMDWLLSNMIGGLKLQVPEADAAKAHKLLEAPVPESIDFEESEQFSQPACPTCGSTDISLDDADRKFLAASMLIGLPWPHRKPKPGAWLCNQCKGRWIEDEEP